MTKVVRDKQRARQTDKERLKAIEMLIEKGRLEEANLLQRTHDAQQKIRENYKP
jgi:hypothetical protein